MFIKLACPFEFFGTQRTPQILDPYHLVLNFFAASGPTTRHFSLSFNLITVTNASTKLLSRVLLARLIQGHLVLITRLILSLIALIIDFCYFLSLYLYVLLSIPVR